jgi:hypothetical protein
MMMMMSFIVLSETKSSLTPYTCLGSVLSTKWDEPRDPAASLADQTLWRLAAKTAHTGSAASTAAYRPPTMASITGIGGDKFSGKPSDWPDTKTEIIGWLEGSGYSYIAKTGTILFHFTGSGDHDHLEDGDLERHYASKMWPTQLRSIRSQVTKNTLDVKCECTVVVFSLQFCLSARAGAVRCGAGQR